MAADPRLLVALSAEASGLQSMLSDFLGRLDLVANVQPEGDTLHRASLALDELAGTLADRAREALPSRQPPP